MKKPGNRTTILVSVLLLLGVGIGAQSTTNIRIFVVNLSSESLDISLGNPVQWQAIGVSAYSASKISPLKDSGNLQLFIRKPGAKDAASPHNDGGQPYLFHFVAGRLYVLQVLSAQDAKVYELAEPQNNFARIAFFNASNVTVSKLQVGSDYDTNTLVLLKELPALAVTNMASVNFAASYSLFWALNSTKQSLIDADGKLVKASFAEGSVWAFVAKPSGDGIAGGLFQIAP